ncbi:S8 family serine peptidase [Massilia sp. CF038]|uniref:S8 family peptidase n=1 Tax=Massilia sp. CF038 TaxID=1881045 RepID=UPI000932505F|nr:S8 family serine peptidase [Massilia sp. CF038]
MMRDYVILRTGIASVASMLVAPPDAAGANRYRIEVDVDRLNARSLAALSRDPRVVAIAPTLPMCLVAPARIDPVLEAPGKLTWGVEAVGAALSKRTGEGVTVAVLDTGIDASHPAFAGMSLVHMDFTGEGGGDANGHGTHCAGTIFGRDVDGLRIGVARGTRRALIGKVLDQTGAGTSEQIVRAMLWAIEEGAHVISISIGMNFPGYVQQMVEAGLPVDLATSRALEGYRANVRLFDTLAAHVKARSEVGQAAIVIAAAGNESRRQLSEDFEVAVSPPANSDGIISVAALGQSPTGLVAADFSNTGAHLSAPGVQVVSAALGGGLTSMSGTSMAAPHVAGVAALWAEQLLATARLNTFALSAKLAGSAITKRLADGFHSSDVGAGIVQSPLD